MPQSSNGTGTLQLADAGKHFFTTGGITVPENASVAFDIGTVITIVSNATSITITQGANVTLRLVNSSSTGNRTLASHGVATLIKVGTNTWYVTGQGVS
jgi:hypothetical protein